MSADSSIIASSQPTVPGAWGKGVSVIVPFRKSLPLLRECLRGFTPVPEWAEAIVVADGAVDRCHELAAAHGARVVELANSCGPAVARNRGAAAATGAVLVFIDADVVPAPGVLTRIRELLHRHPDVAAVFGAYDEQPREPGFISQYKNLSHSYFHQTSRREAQTFWAGLGAVRREQFARVGGFDERFRRPCVEDIELGYRLRARGCRILVEPAIQGCHLKRWSFASAVVCDVRDRGIPWTQLMLKFGRMDNDLNLHRRQRLAIPLAYLLLAFLALTATAALAWLVAAALVMVALVGLNWHYYAFFVRRRGFRFGCLVVPMHILHHLCNGLSFVAGCAIFHMTSRFGAAVPGSIPRDWWSERGSPGAATSLPVRSTE
jgi:GT2 family glycosyltransferase